MNHEIDVSNLMFNKTSEKINFNKYDINVDLEEESSDDQKTILKYSLDLTSNPKNSVINISGNTILSGEKSEIEEFLKQENEKTPEVVSLIYQELFPLMYIISKNMKIPSPAHTLSQNIVSEIDQNKNLENSNEKIESVDSKKEDEASKNDQIKEEQKNAPIDQEESDKNNSLKDEISSSDDNPVSNENKEQDNPSET
ncbi:MAG: hypothetical protein OEL77_06800 [Nitrosopumilus sp.]|nr:hypothetical protein [Nitrosopumilus sp.]MDH3385704.1 hypothetical protein [Nitrosopumilus sp.]